MPRILFDISSVFFLVIAGMFFFFGVPSIPTKCKATPIFEVFLKVGKHSCLCLSVCHPCRFNNTISFCVFWSSCATRKLVFSRSVHSEFWSSRFPEDFWFFFCFVLGVRMMLQARASKIVSRAGFDATTDISNRKCRAFYAIFQFFWSLPQCFFFSCKAWSQKSFLFVSLGLSSPSI